MKHLPTFVSIEKNAKNQFTNLEINYKYLFLINTHLAQFQLFLTIKISENILKNQKFCMNKEHTLYKVENLGFYTNFKLLNYV